MTENNAYRPCVGIVLVNAKGLILVCKRIDAHLNNSNHAWQMPQGGIDKNESPQAAALRELAEETGILSVEILKEHSEWLNYDLPENIIKKFKDKKIITKGQTQKWYLMRFKGEDTEINFNQKHAEFCEFAWVDKNEVLERVVPFKKNVYKQVIQAFDGWLA